MKTRIISGAVLVLIGLITILTGGPILLAVLIFCALTGMYELDRVVGRKNEDGGHGLLFWLGCAGCVFFYLMIHLRGGAGGIAAAALTVCAMLVGYVAEFPRIKAAETAFSVFGFFYVPVMLGFIYLIRQGSHGLTVVWLVFISSWVADTCAYFTGRYLGKTKMAPELSPKKTVEGAIGGVVGAALVGLIFSAIFEHGMYNWQFALICGLASILSIFGDLAASAIKREYEIKDFGTLIPGHGGILDRFDSVIITAPAIYFLTLILMGSGTVVL